MEGPGIPSGSQRLAQIRQFAAASESSGTAYHYDKYIPAGRQKFGNRIRDINGQPAFQWALHQASRQIKDGRFVNAEQLVDWSGDIVPGVNLRTTEGKRHALVNARPGGPLVFTDEVAKVQGGKNGFHGSATFQQHLFERVGVGQTFKERPMTTQMTHYYDQEPGGEMRVDSRITKP